MAAEAIVSTVLEQLILITVTEAKKEVRLVVGVKKEIKKLATKFEAIQTLLVDAEQRQVRETAVGVWLDRLKAASYDMDDILDKWNTKILELQIEEDANAQFWKNIKISLVLPLGVSKNLKYRKLLLLLRRGTLPKKSEEEAMQPGRTKEEGIKKKHEFNSANYFVGNQSSMGDRGQTTIASGSSWLQCAEHWRRTFCARLVSAGEFYPSKRSNSSLVVMGIFDYTKASGNVTSLGVSSQSNAAAGEDSNEVEDVGLLLGWMLLEATLNAGIGGNVGIEKACNSSITFNSYKYNIRSLIVTYSLYVLSSNIIYYEDLMVVGIIDLKRFIMRTNTYTKFIARNEVGDMLLEINNFGMNKLLNSPNQVDGTIQVHSGGVLILFLLGGFVLPKGEMEIMKVSYQSNAVGGTSNKVEDEIAVK
ncbi:hypothetical protein EZV62_003772 [Acer yangbiense]|uniref:Disease resistance N-terminal domain-containing protein n=1 Tax=Acer yangbiense TaxID=1000413 RepID=A0A5C7IHM7_9ROSI|nr:hypothetical protein EZV62_003772 [Acer yangbiense]